MEIYTAYFFHISDFIMMQLLWHFTSYRHIKFNFV